MRLLPACGGRKPSTPSNLRVIPVVGTAATTAPAVRGVERSILGLDTLIIMTTLSFTPSRMRSLARNRVRPGPSLAKIIGRAVLIGLAFQVVRTALRVRRELADYHASAARLRTESTAIVGVTGSRRFV